jgi:transposase-like protein
MKATQEATTGARPRRQRVNRTRAQWRTLVEQHRGSGLTVGAFCTQVGASTSAFARWRRVFGSSRARRASGKSAVARPEAARTAALQPQFVEITPGASAAGMAATPPALASGVRLRIELGAGVVLELHRE